MSQLDPQDPSDDADLRAALLDLSALAMGSSLETSLARIATIAVQAVPGADGAGVTMLEEGRPATVAVSAPFVQQVDDIQYGIGEGPCITAAAEARTVRSGSLGADPKWARFGPQAFALGVASAVSMPLILDGEVLGALNVYAYAPDAFTEHAAAVGEVFAIPAAVTVFNARVLMQARRLAAQLQTALTSRTVIDHAIGIVMSRQGCTPEEAFARLRETSQRQNVKLAQIAETLTAEAVRRARARHVQGT